MYTPYDALDFQSSRPTGRDETYLSFLQNLNPTHTRKFIYAFYKLTAIME